MHSIELLELRPEQARLRITCGSGTYVRSLVRDLGEALGCGAHVAELRRLWVDPFRAPRMFTIEALGAMSEADREQCLLPVEAGLAGWRTVALTPEQAQRLGQGQVVAIERAEPGEVQVTDSQGRSLGLAEIGSDSILRAKRLFRWAARH